jgi:methyltransferase (TIGR00027 family)
MKNSKRIKSKSSKTAAYTCTCRASSFLETNSYFKSDDYIAVKLLPRFVKYLLKLKILDFKGIIAPKGIYPYVIARTKYIDDIFLQAKNAGFEQIVIFGAGFDSRAIRLLDPNSNIKVFEIDTYYTLNAKAKQFKKRNIAKPDTSIYIPIDFNKENIKTKLYDNQLDTNKKTLSILEGLTMYLSHSAVAEMFKLIYEYSASGSLVVFDYIYASVLRRELKYYGESAIYTRVKKDKEQWTFGIEEGGIENYLSTFKFDLIDHLDSNNIEKKYFHDSSGNSIIKVNGTHCIVLAKIIK